MSKSLEKEYNPAEIEPRWYSHWLERNYFRAEESSDKEPFCIVIPPPNVTGELHMGHALTMTIEDILIRHKRMSGFNALWLPGTDHAGIATQTVVERELAKEGKNRWDMGREEFVKRVWQWKQEKGGKITNQLKYLGSSLDWEKERFTLDDGLSRAVREVFVRLYEQGLIYRDYRLINWCPHDRTALSDLEVEHEEYPNGEMWSFAYPLVEGGEIVVATTRPETMLGDTAIAVHPEDERYKHLIGKKVKHPLLDREFPIVGDAILVDREFGTGAVKVTPAHDFNDFEVGKRHNLEMINILTREGRLNENCGEFNGLEVMEARKAVKSKLAEMGLERGSKKHLMAIGRCQRCGTIVEPFLSFQWFIKIKPLADRAIKAVEEGKITFTPKLWEKTYFNWMYNIQDWCISRQLWWGHQIPVWYCDDCEAVNVSRTDLTKCEKCGSTNIKRDEDVLDTWFSSALWPFSTLGWPEQTPLLKTFYPTSIMETGFDIIFFWVARMIMMGLHFMDEVPFRKVYLHAMVRDWKGEKMSKTRGNVIDPLALIHGATAEKLPPKVAEKFKEGFPACGADALRFTLAIMAAQGHDVKLDPKRVEGYRFFANKLYNAAKFSIRFFGEDFKPNAAYFENDANVYNRWIRSELETLIKVCDEGIENFRLDDAAENLYRFVWNSLCDWYIELSKPILYDESHPDREAVRQTLYYALKTTIKLLHPIMPFITEEIWHAIPHPEGEAESIMIADYPKAGKFKRDEAAKAEVEMAIEAVTAPRNLRTLVGLPPSQKVEAIVFVHQPEMKDRLSYHKAAITKLAGLSGITQAETSERPEQSLSFVGKYIDCFILLKGLIDIEAERKRLGKELEKAEKLLKAAEAKLTNERFISQAPPEVVEKEREKLNEFASQCERLKDTIKQLS